MFRILWLVLIAVESGLGVMVGYLLLLTGAAWHGRKEEAPPIAERKATHRFLILVPAHNEERLLPDLLDTLNRLDYPRALYEVHVVADNCTDRTAVVARDKGATVHERRDQQKQGKGYALQWLLHRLWQTEVPHDAVVILDADSLVSSNFLEVMDARLAQGERVIQAYYAVRHPGRSWSVGLRYAALALLHYLRPLGRMVLGASAGLKGNGMVFAANVLRHHDWTASITEDIEFHMALLLDGERVTFAPEAVVSAEMPETLAGSQTQHMRWEQGRLQMARQYIPQLVREARACRRQGAWRRAYVLLDAVMEHLIPPFSILAGLSIASFLAALVLPITNRQRQGGNGRRACGHLKVAGVLLSGLILLGQAVYTFAGLRLARAPRHVYRALLYTPVLIMWKIWLYMRVLLQRGPKEWIRTARNA